MRFVPLLMIALVAIGCASSRDVTQMRQDVSTVYNEQTTYQERTNARISKIERDTKELQKNITSLDGGLRKQVADLAAGEETQDDKIRNILGRIDELESQMRTYWDQVRNDIRELKKAKEVPAPPPVTPKVSAEEMYKRGFDTYQKGAYDDATRLFSQFVKENPNDALAPNALFWTGESYMNLKDYEKAIVQFQELLDKFPEGDKASRAMLRQGEAFGALGDKKSSTTLMKRVVELFPKSEEARVAQRRLRGGTLQ
jgi:tol-pal system protein YbgF